MKMKQNKKKIYRIVFKEDIVRLISRMVISYHKVNILLDKVASRLDPIIKDEEEHNRARLDILERTTRNEYAMKMKIQSKRYGEWDNTKSRSTIKYRLEKNEDKLRARRRILKTQMMDIKISCCNVYNREVKRIERETAGIDVKHRPVYILDDLRRSIYMITTMMHEVFGNEVPVECEDDYKSGWNKRVENDGEEIRVEIESCPNIPNLAVLQRTYNSTKQSLVVLATKQKILDKEQSTSATSNQTKSSKPLLEIILKYSENKASRYNKEKSILSKLSLIESIILNAEIDYEFIQRIDSLITILKRYRDRITHRIEVTDRIFFGKYRVSFMNIECIDCRLKYLRRLAVLNECGENGEMQYLAKVTSATRWALSEQQRSRHVTNLDKRFDYLLEKLLDYQL